MTRLCVLTGFVLATSAFASDTLKLAAPGLTVVGLAAEKAEFFSEHLAGRLTGAGAEVTTGKAIQQLLGLDRQRQLLGCNEQRTSCVVEMANALGTDGIVFGEIAKVGDSFQVNVKVLGASNGRIVSNVQQRARSEEGILDVLDAAALQLARECATALGRTLEARGSTGGGPSLRTLALIPAGVGVVAAIAGGVLLGNAGAKFGELPTAGNGRAALPLAEAQALAAEGSGFQTAGWVCLGVAAAGLGTAGLMFFLGGESSVSAALVPSPNGATFAVVGTF